MTEKEIQIRAGDRPLDCYIAFPEGGPARHPAVVIVHEIFGVDAHMRDVARRFAAEGYIGVAPNLFTGEVQRVMTPANIGLAMQSLAHVPPELRRDPTKFAEFAATQPPERRPVLEAFAKVTSPKAQDGFANDLRAVTQYLRGLPEVDPARVGCVGFCFGGAMTARLATHDPDLRAAVIFYGQNPPLEEVPRIRASVLGLYGGEDKGISDTVPTLAETMQKEGKRFEYHIYPGAKHAFFNDTRAQVYHPESAADAWKRVLAFFGRELRA